MRRVFLVPISNTNIEKILSFCVNNCVTNCTKSNDKSLFVVKLRESYEVPSFFKGLEEVTDKNFFKTDIRFKQIEE